MNLIRRTQPVPATKIADQRIPTEDKILQAIWNKLGQLISASNSMPFPGGRVVSVSFLLANKDQPVEHGLGLDAACFVIRGNYRAAKVDTIPSSVPPEDVVNAPIVVTESNALHQIDRTKLLFVQSSAIGIVDLFFYPRASKVIQPGATQSR